MDRKNEFAAQVNAIDLAHKGQAHESLWQKSAILRTQITALRQRLRAGDARAIGEALDFLEIRKPVFGVGYEQEKLARSLKQTPLDASDVARVEFLVLKLIQSELEGGQLRELVRVLIGRCSDQFQTKLRELCGSSTFVVRRRAQRTISVVVNERRRPTRT